MRQFFFQISLHRWGRCSGATARRQRHLSPVTLREATTRRDPSIHPRARRIEAEQSSLYRRHTKPFESWEPFSPFVLHLIVFSSRRVSLRFRLLSRTSVFHSAQLFLQLVVPAQTMPFRRASVRERSDAPNAEFAETCGGSCSCRRRDVRVIARLKEDRSAANLANYAANDGSHSV